MTCMSMTIKIVRLIPIQKQGKMLSPLPGPFHTESPTLAKALTKQKSMMMNNVFQFTVVGPLAQISS